MKLQGDQLLPQNRPWVQLFSNPCFFSFKMEIHHTELSTANAAKLFVVNLLSKLNCKTAPHKELNEAIIPLFGIRWDLVAIRRVGARLIRRILWCIRNSKLPDKEYNRITHLWDTGVATTDSFPRRMGKLEIANRAF